MCPPLVNDPASTVYDKLKELSVHYEAFDHPPARTVEDFLSVLQGKQAQPVKNLFLVDKKKRYFVVSAAATSDVSMKVLSSQLNASNCRFVSEDLMKSLLGVEPGAVTPFAALNDTTNTVTFVMDSALKTSPLPIAVHPLRNTATVILPLKDVVTLVEHSGHSVQWIDLSAKATDKGEAKSVEKKPAQTMGTESLGVTAKKSKNFSEWYTQAITRSEMVEYYDISGCYILRPWSFFLWECVQHYMDRRIKKLGVQNAYFPMFVSKSKLETEKDHVEGFSPEVAWVTRYGDSELAEPIAIRPTSETIIYPAYAKWIRSHRDLPLKLNQWCQVVRWEFKQPTPFIRTREFLWQEGHTAHATDEEAEDMMFQMLDVYKDTYEEVLAVPVIKGLKSDNEKFAGGKITSTVEAFIQENGRAVQAATSHHLGTNFSKMFGVEYEDREGKRQLVHQTSWGYSTRSLGVVVMVHGDDKGVVMPPRAAPKQVVLIPIVYKEDTNEELLKQCKTLCETLEAADIRVTLDDRDNYTPGWKYNDWEKRGVCLRMEVGPRDMTNKTVRIVRRDTNDKMDCPWDTIVDVTQQLLEQMHQEMLQRARDKLHSSIVQVTEWKDVQPHLNARKLILAPWCEDPETEDQIKKATTSTVQENGADEDGSALTAGMKSICVPLDQPPLPEGTKCFFTQRPAKRWWLFGRSY